MVTTEFHKIILAPVYQNKVMPNSGTHKNVFDPWPAGHLLEDREMPATIQKKIPAPGRIKTAFPETNSFFQETPGTVDIGRGTANITDGPAKIFLPAEIVCFGTQRFG